MRLSEKQKRIAMSLAGVLIAGLCVGTFQAADLGADPFTCFVTGIATVFNLFGIGYTADFMKQLLHTIWPDPSMMVRVELMLLGVLGSCFAASLYFTADLGVSAYDAWSLIVAYRYKIAAFRVCRIVSDCICVLVGFLAHVTIGVGTVITALLMGPIIQWFNIHVSEPMLYAKQRKKEKA